MRVLCSTERLVEASSPTRTTQLSQLQDCIHCINISEFEYTDLQVILNDILLLYINVNYCNNETNIEVAITVSAIMLNEKIHLAFTT